MANLTPKHTKRAAASESRTTIWEDDSAITLRFDDDGPATERTRLLAGSGGAGAEDPEQATQQHDKLPVLQTLALCWARSIEVWIFFSIFPFLPAFVQRTGVPQPEIGYYVGIVESIFALTQFAAMMVWSGWSDRYGRKPVLCTCLVGASLSAFLFGLSTKIWHMLILRALAGVFSASATIVRVLLSESTSARNAARAYSYLSTTAQLALFAGPMLAGILYEPCERSPWLATHFPLLATFPALLPSFFNGLFALGAAATVFFFVRETKPAELKSDTKAEQPTYRSVLTYPGTTPVVIMFLWQWSYGNSFGAITPVFYFTNVELGGWGFSTENISLVMGFLGVAGAIYALFFFASFTSRFGTRKMIQMAGVAQVIVYSWPISSNILLRHGFTRIFMAILPAMLLLQAVAGISAGISLQLALNSAAAPGALGLINGLAFALGAAQRSILPAGATALFAVTVEKQLLDGHLAWYIIVGWTALYNAYVWRYATTLPGVAKDNLEDDEA